MKILPMQGVRAIGLKLAGLAASSAAELLAMSVMAADFHSAGMTD